MVIPFWGFNNNTQGAIKKRKGLDVEVDGEKIHINPKDDNYVSLSPHAAYDSTRNSRTVANKLGSD